MSIVPNTNHQLFHFGLLLPIWCFSALENYQVEVCFDLRMTMTLSNTKSDLWYRKTTKKKLTETLAIIIISPLDTEWRTGSITSGCFGKWARASPTPISPPPGTSLLSASCLGLSLLGWNPKSAGNRALVAHRATTRFLHYCESYPSREAISQLWFREPSGSDTHTVSGLLHRSAGLVLHKNWHWRLRAKPHTQW